ncbi:Uncharacterised protein [Vibrio cholerae]|nr:Uncharacterised protein [Vibrio cholerae]
MNGAFEPSRLITIGFTFSPYPAYSQSYPQIHYIGLIFLRLTLYVVAYLTKCIK